MARQDASLAVTDGDLSLPAMKVLTGRGFITGKSGSGKSNTASVVCEELLANDLPFLIIDADGEYYGLKEEYDLLHVGADDRCDYQVGPAHAEPLVEIALEEELPVILDVSGYLDQDASLRMIEAVVTELFVAEHEARKPFLLLVEEVHEFLPESGKRNDAGEQLVRVAKRGRKRGLGLCGMSQRPASVSKDFITQCNWLVWHRLTWENDTRLVQQIMGSDAADAVRELDTGQAMVTADWLDNRRKVQFRRKTTYDAGATPGMGDTEEPTLRAPSRATVQRLAAVDHAVTPNPDPIEDADDAAEAISDSLDEPALEDDAQEPAGAEAGAEDGVAGGDDGGVPGDGDGGDGGTETGGGASGEPAPASAAGRSRRGSSRPQVEAGARTQQGDPLWEFGQLTGELLVRTGGAIGAGLRGAVRRTAAAGSALAGRAADAVGDDGDRLGDGRSAARRGEGGADGATEIDVEAVMDDDAPTDADATDGGSAAPDGGDSPE